MAHGLPFWVKVINESIVNDHAQSECMAIAVHT